MRLAHGHGLASVVREHTHPEGSSQSGVQAGTVLDAWFPSPTLGPAGDGDDRFFGQSALDAGVGDVPERGVAVERVFAEIDLDEAPADTVDAYLRLHMLSHRLATPNSIRLDGIFSLLPINVWTSAGPTTPAFATQNRMPLQRAGLQIQLVDRFPRMTDYVMPDGVRIADASRVRLGAHLAPGTVVMHEGFVNFNAGTLGTSMVEGRISQGVVVGNGSDIGGGASVMGTLSGGGTEQITIGERVLLGANAGVGISLGDDCIVEAGLYVTAGSRVTDVATGTERKAKTLSGVPNLLFRRNSVSGAVEVLERSGSPVTLNAALH